MAKVAGTFPLLIGGEYDRQPVPPGPQHEIRFYSKRGTDWMVNYVSDAQETPTGIDYNYEVYRPMQLAINGRIYLVWAARTTRPAEVEGKLLEFLMNLYAK